MNTLNENVINKKYVKNKWLLEFLTQKSQRWEKSKSRVSTNIESLEF